MIRLRWQLARDGKGGRVPVKTDAGERDIPILPALRRRLIAHRLASLWTRPGDAVFATATGKPKAYRIARRALGLVADDLGVDLVTHDFRRSMASFLIIAARADEAAVTGVMEHANIETTRRIYAADWREAEERNEVLMGQLAEAGIVSDLQRNKLGVTRASGPKVAALWAVFRPVTGRHPAKTPSPRSGLDKPKEGVWERPGTQSTRLDKLGVTGSSPIPPTHEALQTRSPANAGLSSSLGGTGTRHVAYTWPKRALTSARAF